MDVYQILAIFTGAIAGVIWEILGTTPFKNIVTITPSLIINLSSNVIHLHHWLLYFGVILIIAMLSIKTGRLFHPSVLMIIFFLLSAMIYDFLKFGDWYIFIK